MDRLFERKDILLSFRKFGDFSTDLFNSDYVTFDNRLDIFIDFCEKDKVMSFITSQLKGYDFTKWKQDFDKHGGSMAGSAKFKLPLNEDDRLSLLYQILLKTNAKELKFLTFCTMAFPSRGKSISESIDKFNEAITRLLVRDLGYKLEEIKDKIEADDDKEIPQESLIVINAQNITNSQIAIGTNIKQMKVSRDVNLDVLVNELCDLILNEKSLKVDTKEDLLSDVESMKIEMQKNNPNKGRVMEYMNNFVTITSLVELSQRIIEYISTSKIFG